MTAEPQSAVPRPLTVGTIFSVGWRILSRHWATLLPLALLFVGPGALLTAATSARVSEVMAELLEGLGWGTTTEPQLPGAAELDVLWPPSAIWFGSSIVAGVLSSLGALGFSAVVVGDYHGRRLGFEAALRVTLQRTPAALGFMLLTTLLIVSLAAGALLLLVLVGQVLGAGSGTGDGGGGPGAFLTLVLVVTLSVGVVVLSMRWAPAYPVIVAEDVGVRGALRRSWHLSGDNIWRIFAVIALASLLAAVVSTLASPILSLLLAGLGSGLGVDELVTSSLALAAATTLVAPVVPVVVAVLYYDLRARRDVAGMETASPGVAPR